MTIELKKILAPAARLWLVGCFGLAGGFALTSCAGGRETVKDDYLPPTERNREPAVGSAPVCVDENDGPVECDTDDECCSGFVCGKDPELNPRRKFCIYAGG